MLRQGRGHLLHDRVGDWKDGKMNGRGSATLSDGTTWDGYYMDGEFVPNICRDMGLTKGSPEHGQCVLKLMDSVLSERVTRENKEACAPL